VIAWGGPLTDPDPARRDPRLDTWEMAFMPLSVVVGYMARRGDEPRTVAAVTSEILRRRSAADGHERAAISQYARARQ